MGRTAALGAGGGDGGGGGRKEKREWDSSHGRAESERLSVEEGRDWV